MGFSHKTIRSLEGRFGKIARLFSRNYGVTVRMAGTACCTTADGTIWIPANSDDLKEEDKDILEGMLDHEVWHQREEQKAKEKRAAGVSETSWPAPMAVFKATKNGRERLLLNVFEDIRIEADARKSYVGVADNLLEMHSRLDFTMKTHVKEALEGKRDPKTGLPKKFDPWWLIGCGISNQAEGRDNAWMPPEYVETLERLRPIIADHVKMVHVGDALDLAKRVLAELKDSIKEEPSEEKGEDGEGEGEPSEGEAGEDGEGEDLPPSPSFGDTDEGEGKKEGKPGKENATAKKPDLKGKPERGGKTPTHKARTAIEELLEKDPTLDDLTEILRGKVKESAEKDAKANRRHIPHPEAAAQDVVAKVRKGTSEQYKTMLDTVRAQVSALRSKITTTLMSQKARRFSGDRERGTLDASSLYSLRFGNRRVFAERSPEVDVNTAIAVLIDQSGSMAGRKALVAAQSAIALSETLNLVNIPFAVYGFDNDLPMAWRARESKDIYNRFERNRLDVFKDFSEPFEAVKTRMVNVTGRGNNVDGEFVMQVGRILASRPERRKILFVLSDGVPLADANSSILHNHLKDTVKQLTEAGVEVFGLGILTDAVKAYYPNHAVVNDLNELAREIFKMLRKFLLEGGGERQKRDGARL